VVLAAGIAVDAGELRKRTQRLLQLQVGRVSGVGQLESGRYHDRIVDDRTDGVSEQAAVNAPILRVELVERLLPRDQLVSDHSVIGRAEHRIGGDGALNAELPVGKVRGPAGPRKVEERALLEEVAGQSLGIGNRRLEVLNLGGERG